MSAPILSAAAETAAKIKQNTDLMARYVELVKSYYEFQKALVKMGGAK